MTVIPTLTLSEAEAQFADAKAELDAAHRAYERRETPESDRRFNEAYEAWRVTRARLEAVRSQQPQRGRGFHDDGLDLR